MDIGRVPTVGRVNIAGAGRRYAYHVLQRAHQYVIARAGPGLVEIKLVAVIDVGIEEQVDRHPALACAHAIGLQRIVEVVGAVHVPGITHVIVVFGRARRPEGVVPPAGVLNDLDQRFEIDVVKLGVQAGCGIRRADHVASGGGIQVAFDTLFQQWCIETLKIRTFATFDVDNLDIVAGPDLVGKGGACRNAVVEQGVRERVWQANYRFLVLAGTTMYEHDEVGRGVLRVGPHDVVRHGNNADQVFLCGKSNRITRW